MIYSQRELRNKENPLLRRLERLQIEARELKLKKEKNDNKEGDVFGFSTPSKVIKEQKPTITKLWLFNKRRGR